MRSTAGGIQRLGILVDNALSPRLAAVLKQRGADAVHVGRLGLAMAADVDVLEEARREKRVVLSADADFPALLALQRAHAPSVLLWRARARRVDAQAELLVAAVQRHVDALCAGAIVVLEDGGTRVRYLPIG